MSRVDDSGTCFATRHASDRWFERVPDADISVETAWSKGIPVTASECDSDATTLYPPGDALLVRKDDRIVTVLPVDYDRLDTTGIVWCSACNCATTLARSLNECEWCGHETVVERSDGNLRIIS